MDYVVNHGSFYVLLRVYPTKKPSRACRRGREDLKGFTFGKKPSGSKKDPKG